MTQQLLEEGLETHGYKKSALMPGFWTHQWLSIQLSLIVNNFRVKYTGKEHAKDPMGGLKRNDKILIDWRGGGVLSRHINNSQLQ